MGRRGRLGERGIRRWRRVWRVWWWRRFLRRRRRREILNMARMSLDSFAQEMTKALGPRLVSLLLYGSAARDGSGADASNMNTLLIVDRADRDLFAPLVALVRQWVAAGHPPPIIL